jgi:hypothetical protein
MVTDSFNLMGQTCNHQLTSFGYRTTGQGIS